MKYRVFSKGCGKVDGFDGGYGMCRRLRVALASKPSLVREGGICPRAEMSKKAKLSSEDSEGIFYGFESFHCYFILQPYPQKQKQTAEYRQSVHCI